MIGPIVGSTLGGWITDSYSWRWVFLINVPVGTVCCITIFCAYLALYAATLSLNGLLESLFGYDALSAGLVMSPAGIFAVLAMPIVGRLLGLRMDARWLTAAGLLIVTSGNYWMSQLNLDISPSQAVWPRVLVVLGLSVCFAPANVAAYLYTPMALRGAAVGLLSLLRNEGGSVGVSLAQTFQERRDQFHTLRLGEYLDPFNAAAKAFLTQAQSLFLQQTADPVALQQLAWQQLENVRQQQASALAYFDCFWMVAVLTFAVAFLVLFMRRSVAEKGARMAQSE